MLTVTAPTKGNPSDRRGAQSASIRAAKGPGPDVLSEDNSDAGPRRLSPSSGLCMERPRRSSQSDRPSQRRVQLRALQRVPLDQAMKCPKRGTDSSPRSPV
ncbi:hypothetical protein CPLU01_08832 [Colletotrichum plurivorum]|uniref:Uncharacterized protein n=1 Tax=Colletotrichum plurivorum TaxID=2175906 RepID=A0A8H6KBX5_9PEZI|nr:hypothetical protein CPLU01_08832 [Colletotrichum plurivorum]